MQFTLDQLRCLETIERTGTFAAAARELHRVPSAITYLVRQLEDALGVTLFERVGRGTVLTPAGRQILERSRPLLDQARALDAVAKHLASGWEAELRIVVDGALPMAPIAACLARFADPNVPTRLRIDVEHQEGVLDQLERLDADLALYLGFDSEAESTAYALTPLPPLEVVLVAATGHRLVGAPATDTERSAYAELLVRDSAERFRNDPKPSFIGSRNVAYLSDFHSKRIALLAGAGYGWIPEHLVIEDLRAGRLGLLDTEFHRWTYAPQIVRRLQHPLGRAGQLFLETLSASLTANIQKT